LLEFFVPEVTARSTVDILGIQLDTSILFYQKSSAYLGVRKIYGRSIIVMKTSIEYY